MIDAVDGLSESFHKMANGQYVKGNLYSVIICFPQKLMMMMNASALKGNGESDILIGMDFLWRHHFYYKSRFSGNQSVNIVGGKLTIELQS